MNGLCDILESIAVSVNIRYTIYKVNRDHGEAYPHRIHFAVRCNKFIWPKVTPNIEKGMPNAEVCRSTQPPAPSVTIGEGEIRDR